MEQQEYAASATRVADGRPDGRTGGTGRGTTDAVLAVPAPAAAPAASCASVTPSVPAPGSRSDGAAGRFPAERELSPDPGLLRLAHWFAAASPGTADDLCTASFGLYPARHFGVPADASADADTSWWHGPTAHAAAVRRVREARPVRGLRRARRDAAALPVVRSDAKAGKPGRHRKPERTRPLPGGQDRSVQERSAQEQAGQECSAQERAVQEHAAQECSALGREAEERERRIAARLLLAHPLVTASGPHADGFPLIRRHRDWLTERFDTLLGYRLVVGPWHARLYKAGLGPAAARRLHHPGTGAPFTPAGYAQLALALALLVDAPEQLPHGRLLEAMRAAAPELPAAPDDRAMALAVLADWQVLDGLPDDPAAVDRSHVLTVDRELARAVPAGPPVLADGAADLVRRAADAEPATAVRRLLAETPAVLAADLPGEQRAWLRDHRLSGPAALGEFLGLEAELRAEGVALLDPADELTDLALPGAGTLPQAALLLVERLVEEVRPLPGDPTDGDVPIPDALIDGVLGDIADEYGLPAGWRRDYLADRTALRRDALDLLHRLGLITPAPHATRPPAWLLRPPAARYAPALDLRPSPGTGRHSRRDEGD
ncbi:DUF2398 family protein [Streptomyces sp. SP17BM10]|uniref:DUF2398 family protein n=1 Tax=Streptomyces sp. SP17BM10 TaxID=3002530 RepID=UPI002E75DE3A|nr:DUF2398 family protein [Streptomyces sp. SP17BM10]MEE1787410.1 DUF2398 family protein [Streptomyces sp. SP17BM10]